MLSSLTSLIVTLAFPLNANALAADAAALALKEKVPYEILKNLSRLNTIEDGLLFLESIDKSIVDKLFTRLSNTIE